PGARRSCGGEHGHRSRAAARVPARHAARGPARRARHRAALVRAALVARLLREGAGDPVRAPGGGGGGGRPPLGGHRLHLPVAGGRPVSAGAGVDTSVAVGAVRLPNPVIAASGTFGYGTEFAGLVDLGALGALAVKGLSLRPAAGKPAPRLVETAGGMLNAIG